MLRCLLCFMTLWMSPSINQSEFRPVNIYLPDSVIGIDRQMYRLDFEKAETGLLNQCNQRFRQYDDRARDRRRQGWSGLARIAALRGDYVSAVRLSNRQAGESHAMCGICIEGYAVDVFYNVYVWNIASLPNSDYELKRLLRGENSPMKFMQAQDMMFQMDNAVDEALLILGSRAYWAGDTDKARRYLEVLVDQSGERGYLSRSMLKLMNENEPTSIRGNAVP